jgi:hypothetical protein
MGLAQFLLVNLRFKLVALLLLVGILAGPASALSRCWMSSFGASKHSCVPHCPIMAMKLATPVMASNSTQTLTCCQVSPAKTEPVSPSLMTGDLSRTAPAAIQVSALVVSNPVAVRSSDAAPPTLVAPSQAALCTFLI